MTDALDAESFLARLRIRETAERYFFCADARAPVGVAQCFARDGRLTSRSEARLSFAGRAAIEAGFGAFPKSARSCHAIASMETLVDGDHATARLFAVSYVAGQAHPGDPVLVRGLRYEDRWIVEDGRWVIAERVHEALWQFQSTLIPTALPQAQLAAAIPESK
jgi:hypothetical protein